MHSCVNTRDFLGKLPFILCYYVDLRGKLILFYYKKEYTNVDFTAFGFHYKFVSGNKHSISNLLKCQQPANCDLYNKLHNYLLVFKNF